MPNTLRLDSSGVAKLIELNPEFKFELQAAVIAEMTKRIFEGKIEQTFLDLVTSMSKNDKTSIMAAFTENTLMVQLVDRLMRETVQRIKDSSRTYAYKSVLPTETRDLIKSQINERIETFVKDNLINVEQTVTTITNLALERVEKRIKSEIEAQVSVEVAYRVNQGVAERLEAILKGLKNDA